MFWAAVMELSPSQTRALLRAMIPSATSEAAVNEILYGSMGTASSALHNAQTAFHIHLMPPTAVALLSPDTSDIVFFPNLGAVSLPRYSSLRTMYDQLLRVLKC